jgi:hypothetical protein
MAGSGSSGASGTDERTIAIWYANKLLDEPHCDPDDDLRTLARQFLRCIETLDELKKRSAVETKVRHKVKCKMFPDPYDEREPVGPCTCGALPYPKGRS